MMVHTLTQRFSSAEEYIKAASFLRQYGPLEASALLAFSNVCVYIRDTVQDVNVHGGTLPGTMRAWSAPVFPEPQDLADFVNKLWCSIPSPIKVGMKVRLSKHTTLDPALPAAVGLNWVEHMDQYVGKVATVTKQTFPDIGRPAWRVDIDKGVFSWREEALTCVDAEAPSPVLGEPSNTCSECKTTNIYIEPRPGYVCNLCRTRRSLFG